MKEYLLLGELLLSHNWRSLASKARCNVFSLEMYAKTQYTHNPLHSGVQPALCFGPCWMDPGFQRPWAHCWPAERGFTGQGSEGRLCQVYRGSDATAGGLSSAPGHFAHFSDNRSDSSFLCIRPTWLVGDICFRNML